MSPLTKASASMIPGSRGPVHLDLIGHRIHVTGKFHQHGARWKTVRHPLVES